MIAILLAATAASAPPVVAMSGGQLLAALNGAWAARGEPAFDGRGRPGPTGLSACSGASMCVILQGDPGRLEGVILTGPSETQDASARYLSPQALLIRLIAPGAPTRPAVTADRLAVDDGAAAEAQLGPMCMRVEMSGSRTMTTTFSRRPCSVVRRPGA